MALERKPAYLRIAEEMGRAIAEGRWAAGGKVPSERAVAEREGVSLMTARRALGELERKGLVTRRVGAGTFVAPTGGGTRRLRDPHEEFQAADCVAVKRDGEWVRKWRNGKTVVVEERVTLSVDGPLGVRPLLEYLGEAAAHAEEEVWAEGGRLRIRQTLYGAGAEAVAVREMEIRGGRIAGWVRR